LDIGIGLPNMVPGASGAEIVDWAQRSEARGFSSLGTLDRILYESYEPLTALAAAAAVTERIGLLTAVLLGPLRTNAPLLAKQAQTVQALSGGRLTLGIGLGAREDDYEASEVEHGERGRLFDKLLSELTDAWKDGGVGPGAGGAPRLVVGGQVDRAFERVARFGDGWIQGASGAEQFAELAPKARAAWSEAGRDGEPRTLAIAYYSLGPDGEENARRDLGHYYEWLGEQVVEMIVGAAATDADAIRSYIEAYEAAACDELTFFPCSSDPEQVDLLAEAVGL
jgi:alkanesulfonate monooxygenase SsuD/methylene tetrahydromethanopterin reductase-like flavin-dependent oxidoreductase (luciferase family)